MLRINNLKYDIKAYVTDSMLLDYAKKQICLKLKLKDSEIKEVVDLLINKYELSTNFLNKLYGIEEKEIAGNILEKLDYMILDKYYLCRLIVLREGINLLSNRELRKKY